MANDPSLILQAMRSQVQFDPIGSYEAGQRARSNQMLIEQRRREEALKQKEYEDAMAVRDVLSKHVGRDGQINMGAALSDLGRIGRGDLAQKIGDSWRTQQAELGYKQAQTEKEKALAGKATADVGESKINKMLSTVDLASRITGGALDAMEKYGPGVASNFYKMGLEQARQTGVDLSMLPAEFDPQNAFAIRQSALETKDRLSAETQKMLEQGREQRHKETIGVTVRGQNLADARSRESNAIAARGNVIRGETDIRKEFEGLPEVKNYKLAYPSYAAIKSAAKRDTPQSDINLIYGIAKLYDPTSVVREGEYNTIANSQAIPEQIKGMAQRIAGGGKLTPETKKQLMIEAENRLKVFEDEYLKAQGTFGGIAQERGLNPKSIFSPIGRISSSGRRRMSKEDLAETKSDAMRKYNKSGAEVEAALKAQGWEIE